MTHHELSQIKVASKRVSQIMKSFFFKFTIIFSVQKGTINKQMSIRYHTQKQQVTSVYLRSLLTGKRFQRDQTIIDNQELPRSHIVYRERYG